MPIPPFPHAPMGRARLFGSNTQGRPAAGQPWADILRTVGARLTHCVQNVQLRTFGAYYESDPLVSREAAAVLPCQSIGLRGQCLNAPGA